MPTLMIVQVQLGRSMDQLRSSMQLDLEMKTTRVISATEVRLETIIVTANDNRRSIESGSASGDHLEPNTISMSPQYHSESKEGKDIKIDSVNGYVGVG